MSPQEWEVEAWEIINAFTFREPYTTKSTHIQDVHHLCIWGTGISSGYPLFEVKYDVYKNWSIFLYPEEGHTGLYWPFGKRWDFNPHTPSELRVTLLRGIICMGLDIAGIEEDLRVTVSAHEKLEWLLEYKERMKRNG